MSMAWHVRGSMVLNHRELGGGHVVHLVRHCVLQQAKVDCELLHTCGDASGLRWEQLPSVMVLAGQGGAEA